MVEKKSYNETIVKTPTDLDSFKKELTKINRKKGVFQKELISALKNNPDKQREFMKLTSSFKFETMIEEEIVFYKKYPAVLVLLEINIYYL